MKHFEKYICFLFGMLAIFFTSDINTWASNPYVLYEQKEEKLITKNLVYSVYKQITTEGMRDFYILRVPINDPNITVKSVDSKKEYGLKETVKNLIFDNNAFAGVNCDFFGMAGDYSAPFGMVINDGKLISANSNINAQKADYSSFAIDNGNNPFMSYVKTETTFLNDGRKNLDVTYVNKITDMVHPAYIDRNVMNDTKSLDNRFDGLFKIVVSDGFITYISKKGENVDIPEDGYIITMSSYTAGYNLNKFSVGQVAEFSVKSSVDLSKIKTMFGGIGRILINGKFFDNSAEIYKKRQPRTALGLTYDRNTVIIMVVDGRTHSIGATNEEMANLMKRFGAYNAMHLDGGGSSTMVVQNFKTDELDVVNTLSDGLQRKVINAIGIFKPTEVSQLNSIKIETQKDKIIAGLPCKIKIYGFDEYLNKIEIPTSDVGIVFDDENGKLEGEYFYLNKTGKIKLSAQYKNFVADKEIFFVAVNTLEPIKKTCTLKLNEQADLFINAICDDGTKIKLDGANLKFSVLPEDLGIIENGKFIALKSGSGYVKCEYLDFFCYIEILSNIEQNDFDMLDIPQSKKFHDKLDADFGDSKISDGSFDFFCVGNMSLPDKDKPANYKEKINKFLSAAVKNSSFGLFISEVDGNAEAKIFKHKNNYYAESFKNVNIINMTAQKGCLFKTNTKQWQNFVADIKNGNADHIIIMLDKDPATFNPNKEYEFFHSILKKFADEGKNIFVIFNSFVNNNVNVKDGVRYINIGSLFKKDKTVNENYQSLKFRVTEKNIAYKFMQ